MHLSLNRTIRTHCCLFCFFLIDALWGLINGIENKFQPYSVNVCVIQTIYGYILFKKTG